MANSFPKALLGAGSVIEGFEGDVLLCHAGVQAWGHTLNANNLIAITLKPKIVGPKHRRWYGIVLFPRPGKQGSPIRQQFRKVIAQRAGHDLVEVNLALLHGADPGFAVLSVETRTTAEFDSARRRRIKVGGLDVGQVPELGFGTTGHHGEFGH